MFSINVKVTDWLFEPCKSEDGKVIKAIHVEGVNEDFQFNAFGFPLNDIAALNGAKSVQEYNAIVAKLQTYVADNPDTSKLSIQELISRIVPRSFQTPSEIERAAMYIGQNLQDKWDEKVEAIREQRDVQREQEMPVESSVVTTTASV